MIAENFAVPADTTLDINLGAAGPVAITASGGNITASQNGVQITFTLASFNGVTVAEFGFERCSELQRPLGIAFLLPECQYFHRERQQRNMTFAAVMGGSVNLGTLSISDGAEAIITPANTQSPTTLNVELPFHCGNWQA